MSEKKYLLFAGRPSYSGEEGGWFDFVASFDASDAACAVAQKIYLLGNSQETTAWAHVVEWPEGNVVFRADNKRPS